MYNNPWMWWTSPEAHGSMYPQYAAAFYPAAFNSAAVPSPSVATMGRVNRGNKKNWAIEEEARLTQLVEEYGTKRWVSIAKQLNIEFYGGNEIRTGKRCRERWHNHLNPGLNSTP